MKYQASFYPETNFGGFTDIDGTMAFYIRINSLLDSSFVILDVGCGRGSQADDPIPFRRNLRIFKGKAARVVGIDVDKNSQNNPFLDEFRLICGKSWPIDNDSIGLIVCDNVLEHIEKPSHFFSEASRVLRNGGYFCVRTPNKWSYFGLLTRVIPKKYHLRVVRVAQEGRKTEDVFPIIYKCNNIWTIKNLLKNYGFECVVYGHESEPRYLEFSKIAYRLGVLHQKFAPSFLKPTIFAFGRIKKISPNKAEHVT